MEQLLIEPQNGEVAGFLIKTLKKMNTNYRIITKEEEKMFYFNRFIEIEPKNIELDEQDILKRVKKIRRKNAKKN